MFSRLWKLAKRDKSPVSKLIVEGISTHNNIYAVYQLYHYLSRICLVYNGTIDLSFIRTESLPDSGLIQSLILGQSIMLFHHKSKKNMERKQPTKSTNLSQNHKKEKQYK